MKVPKWIPLLFWIAAFYDGVLGIVFLLNPGLPFRIFEVTPPNHMGYVQFPAALLLIFALMFIAIARQPVAQRNLIVYGILLKVAYCSVTSFYWISSALSDMWKPFFWIDLVMMSLFAWSLALLRRQAAPSSSFHESRGPGLSA